MSFDTIIIGGGLSGLTAGIALAKAGQQVALAAAGQSTLNYFSGSFDLLGYNAEGKVVSCPLDEINNLPASHPYAKIGADAVAHLAAEAQTILDEAGIDLKGDASGNHSRITPLGVPRPAWLSLDDCLTADTDFQIPNFNFQVLNIEGFLDFPVEFIAHGLEQMGAQATTHIVTLKIMQANRKSPYETRATSIARLMDNDEILRDFAAEVKSKITNLQPHTSNLKYNMLHRGAGLARIRLVRRPTKAVVTQRRNWRYTPRSYPYLTFIITSASPYFSRKRNKLIL